MNRFIGFFAIILIAYSCKTQKEITVGTVSEMRKVMMGEDLSAHLRWDTFVKKNLYALAPLGRIEGEVTILNGSIYTSKVDSNHTITIDKSWNVESPFSVYAYVKEWQSFEIDELIHSEEDLQRMVEKVAKKNGYNLDKAFPYRIFGTFDSIDFHIISKPKYEIEHNHDLHDSAKKRFYFQNIEGELLGFYSKNHVGVFTHRGKFTHTHFIDTNQKLMGHLDNVSIKEKYTVLLPKI